MSDSIETTNILSASEKWIHFVIIIDDPISPQQKKSDKIQYGVLIT